MVTIKSLLNLYYRMLVYNDNHPLASGAAEIDNAINACLWLQEYVGV